MERWQRAWPAALATLALAVALGLGGPLQRLQDTMLTDEVRLQALAPPAASTRFLSLGHHEAFADLIWLNALSFTGRMDNHYRTDDPREWLSPLLDALVTVDPSFELAYRWAATMIVYRNEFTAEDVLLANEYLYRGLQRFPHSWRIHHDLGFNYLFELRSGDAERTTLWRQRGTWHMARAAEHPQAPPAIRSLATSQALRHEGWQQAVGVAERQAVSELDQRTLGGHFHVLRLLRGDHVLTTRSQEREAWAWLTRRGWHMGTSRESALVFHPDLRYARPSSEGER